MIEEKRAGFIAVIGSPNAGKSTLINHFIGQKVTIVTRKVQTTRSVIRGICIHKESQLVFSDTPGIFEPKRRLDRAMVEAAWGSSSDADIILFLYDAQKSGIDNETNKILDELGQSRKKKILVLNKVDLVDNKTLLPLIKNFESICSFDATFIVSALTGEGSKEVLSYLAKNLPKGPWLYPEDEITDLPARLLAAEITREQIFMRLHQELPYATTVETEEWTERDDGAIVINQIIYLKKAGHKKIVIGKNGSMIKMLGKAARLEIEQILERSVHLFLFVKVREKWMDDPDRYKIWGLNPNA
ncbi:MAG: GTPase Era [Pseudomonadota bacterium]|nr:GTPase Era [Pseudomonadota bacterium]MEC8235698.1 GTPase Era [Pseudomonadota bacterium]MED5300813.1 GTPase Era [Pseudomonadota bacterium]MEE3007571.1 GTPase Era [Pseudomonadota bacterium]|tara:strand:- start:232 stop:1134 length:903 start_codon:yes stop_codon:yes gene_type:complete